MQANSGSKRTPPRETLTKKKDKQMLTYQLTTLQITMKKTQNQKAILVAKSSEVSSTFPFLFHYNKMLVLPFLCNTISNGDDNFLRCNKTDCVAFI